MARLIACAIAALLVGGATPAAHAQTAQQWSQLVAYVGKLANRMLSQQTEIERLLAENEQQRVALNATIAALDNERCRVGRLTNAVRSFAVAPPAVPVYPSWIDADVACVDLKSTRPPIPAPLPAAQPP